MPADLGVFDKVKNFEDYRRADEEFQLKKQLAQAQVLQSQAAIAKAMEIDADKLGEQAFLKASQGIPLTAQEGAALQYIDAKSPTAAFNPVTGVLEQKPSLLDRAGLSFGAPAPRTASPAPRASNPSLVQAGTPEGNQAMGELFGGGGVPESMPQTENKSEWDIAFEKEMMDAAGNPKLQQVIRENFAKAKLSMTEYESKNAAYADRFRLSEPVLTDPDKISAYSSAGQRALDWINPFGDQINSPEYRAYNQARKNATTAKLRQESGATINPSEFKTDDETLYPQVNDTPELIEQKKLNREVVRKGLERGAGPAYKPAPIIKSGGGVLKPGDTKTSPTGTYMFNGGDPADQASWKKVK